MKLWSEIPPSNLIWVKACVYHRGWSAHFQQEFKSSANSFSSLTYLTANTGFSFINWDQIESNIWSAPVQTTLNHEILWNVLIAKQLPAVAEEVRSLTSLTQLNLRFDQLTTASDKRMKSSMRLFLHILHLAFCILHKCNFMISKLGFYHNFFIVAILLHGLSLMRYDCRKNSSLFSIPLATQYWLRTGRSVWLERHLLPGWSIIVRYIRFGQGTFCYSHATIIIAKV